MILPLCDLTDGFLFASLPQFVGSVQPRKFFWFFLLVAGDHFVTLVVLSLYFGNSETARNASNPRQLFVVSRKRGPKLKV